MRGQTLAHHAMAGPMMRPGADVAGPEAEAGGRHGLLHRGPIEQHGAVARETAVQLVSRALQCYLVSVFSNSSMENQCNFPPKVV